MTKEERAEMLALMQEAMQPINSRLDSIEAKQDTMSEKLTKLEIKVENETDRAIKILGEGHTILNRKFDDNIDLDGRVETLEHKVSAVEYALKQAK